VLLGNGDVTLLSGDGGAPLWTGESHIKTRGGGLDAGEDAVMLYDERGIYVLSKSGATGFTEDGRRLWYLRLEGAAAIPAFGDDGILYSGGTDWILYAYKLEDRVRRGRDSLYGPPPEGSYGTGSPPPSSWADHPYRFGETEMDGEMDRIEAALRSGTIGENELEYTAYLMETAGSGSDPTGAPSPVQVRHRARALSLLSAFGSGETIPFLVRVFTLDADMTIKAAAAGAIGAIGHDPEALALRNFAAAIFSPLIREDQVMISVAAAAGSICRFSGPPLSDTGVKILTALTGDPAPAGARARARRELQTLRP
jgi:outer membrane protein assembly factor BamB